ncbi:MAG: hypothetical protein U0Q22_03635 [Acidimicrobiales bacterium]
MNDQLAHIPRTAQEVAALVAVPAALTEAIDAHRAALAVGEEHASDIATACMSIKPADVADLVAAHARFKVENAAIPEARGEIGDLLARRIIRELAAAGPQIIDGLRPNMVAAAETFSAAVKALPSDVSPESLVRSVEAVQALHTAETARVTLDTGRKIRDELANLGVRAPGDARLEQWTRYLDLEDAAAIDRCRNNTTTGTLGRWHGWITTPGVRGIWWPTIEEQTAAIDHLAAVPQLRQKPDPTLRLRPTRALGRA